MINLNQFQKARLKLTAWYVLVSFLMLSFFTAAAIVIEVRAFDKIQAALSNPFQRPKLTVLLDRRLEGFEADFQSKLIVTDLILLVIASGASYFLSGKTLQPIEEMVKEQQSFAAEASHELRTPLAVMGVELETFKRTEKKMPSATLKVVESTLEEIRRMGKIVDQLLLLVRPIQKEKLVNFNLTEMAEEMIGTIKSYWRGQRNLVINFPNKTAVLIRGDKDQVKQVMMILLDNAGKYTPNGGSVTVNVSQRGMYGVLSVKDTGVGIAGKDLPHIFERFYRGSTSGVKGAGLGLAIAKKILESLHGKIRVKSELAKGSEFIVELPLAS